MLIESDLGTFYHTERCTARFTDNFGITTNLINYHTYTIWPRIFIWTQKSPNFKKHIRKTNAKLHWMLKATSLNQIQLISTKIFILQNWLWASKAAKVSSTGFCCKATIRTAFCYYVNWVWSRFILLYGTVHFTVYWQIRDDNALDHTTQSDQESSFEHRKTLTSENTSERQTHYCTGF